MSITSTLPAPVIQMGHVEKIADTVQNQPVVQQVVAQEAAIAELKRQNKMVQGTNPSDPTRKVREREAGGQPRRNARPGAGQDDGQEAGQDAGPEAGEAGTVPAETGGTPGNPWAGRLLNVKI